MGKLRIAAAFVLTLALTASAWAGVLGDDKFQMEFEKEKEAVKLVKDTARGGYDLLNTDELKALIDKKEPMVIVDTMPYEDSYKKEHVPGAVSFLFPIPDMAAWEAKETAGKAEADYAALLGPDKGKLIVVYCGFVKCTRSHNGAVWAKQLGYTNVKRYPGGIFAWKGAGFPVEAAK